MSKKKIYKTTSVRQTQQAARDIISRFLSAERSGAFVLALSGELGAGKTHFAQGVAKFFGVGRNITSPTFVIMKRYDIVAENTKLAKLYGIKNLYHFDAYRISAPSELKDLGWEDIASNAQNMVVVEWAEKVKDIIPADAVWVEFKGYNGAKRELTVSYNLNPKP